MADWCGILTTFGVFGVSYIGMVEVCAIYLRGFLFDWQRVPILDGGILMIRTFFWKGGA